MLDRDVMQLACCWTIERRDGAGLALTSHDEMLSIDGVRFEPGAGLTPKALRFDGSGDTGESAVTGAVTSALLDEMSLLAGHWDGARVRLFMVDWSDPEGEQVELLAGELGQVDKVGEEFEVALLTAFAKLDAPACPETSPLCRAELGDRKCRIDLATRQRRARVSSANGATTSRSTGCCRPTDARDAAFRCRRSGALPPTTAQATRATRARASPSRCSTVSRRVCRPACRFRSRASTRS